MCKRPLQGAFPLAVFMVSCIGFSWGVVVDYANDYVYVDWKQWRTNTEKTIVDFGEIYWTGLGKDGVPAIRNPWFVSISAAGFWLADNDPVISVMIGDEAKAYPLEILIWHEIVNDSVGGVEVVVTFCSLCYSAVIFDRRVEGRVYDFAVTGFLRNSDMIMYDTRTETLWQQFTGQAIVGDLVGNSLAVIPTQIISFEQFRKAYPKGMVMSRDTGRNREYGLNPYIGYDDIGAIPFLYRGVFDERLLPMQRVITVGARGTYRAYPYDITREMRVINDELADQAIVIFHTEGAVSAVDNEYITNSRQVGSTGVYYRKLDDQVLVFYSEGNQIIDEQTGSVWDVTGRAIDGPLKGKWLRRFDHQDTFAFAWFAFWPDTEIYRGKYTDFHVEDHWDGFE